MRGKWHVQDLFKAGNGGLHSQPPKLRTNKAPTFTQTPQTATDPSTIKPYLCEHSSYNRRKQSTKPWKKTTKGELDTTHI